MHRIIRCILIIVTVGTAVIAAELPVYSQPATSFGKGAGEYERLFDALQTMLEKQQFKRELMGKERLIFVPWIRDQVHVMKAMKFIAPELSSLLEMFLETQTQEGIYFDYFYAVDRRGINHRMNIFDHRYWNIFSNEKLQMHRLPVEADLEYLMVEGVYDVWQATGDKSFVAKWLPALEKGMRYAMNDPLRWSKKYGLVKRGYTIDTWDFMQLPVSREEYTRQGGDIQDGIFNIGPETPMGIMHGDNSGMYAACRQLGEMYRALGKTTDAGIWDGQARLFQLRMNKFCWNGRFYVHFVEDDPLPPYLHMDQINTLSLSNPYDINRGVPTHEMAVSIIEKYRELKENTKDASFAEWFGIYPPVMPHFADYEPGSYVNGGVLTIVAGELAKAAFQHGYETYGVDILDRILKLVDKHEGKLPVGYKPDGTVDSGIPDNWGQAAVYSAMIEGLAGVVDTGCLFKKIELSPRWMAAGINDVQITVAYGPSGKHVTYTHQHDKTRRLITLNVTGDPEQYNFRILLPEGIAWGDVTINGNTAPSEIEQVRKSNYLVINSIAGGARTVEVKY